MQLRDEDDLQSSNTDRGRPMPLRICIAQNNDATFHENKYSHGILERMALVLHTISLVRHFDCFAVSSIYSKGCSNTGINSRALSLPRLKHSSHDPFHSSAWHPLLYQLGVKFCPFRWMADDVQRRDESIFSCIVISDIVNIWLTLAEAEHWVEDSSVA